MRRPIADNRQEKITEQLIRPSAAAIAVGMREPYHLTYIKKQKEVKSYEQNSNVGQAD